MNREPYNEADTRAKLIDPAIHARGWSEDLIRREESAPAVEIINGRPRRRHKGRIDYTLRIKVTHDTQPVAVALLEAKKESLPPGHGLQQAKGYASCKRLNVPFVFSSNGHLFVEFSSITGLTSQPKPLEEFPTPGELRKRYEQARQIDLDSELAKPLLVKYAGGEAQRRYYQDAAIRAVFEKIARGEKRALLSLATGAGKTFIAVNLLRRIADAGQLKRALFLCDRDELRSQGLGAFTNVFGANAAPVYQRPDGKNNAKNARIHIATYQTLDVDRDDSDGNFLTKHYPENHFSHIIIDECHRSAWGKWSQVLKRNSDAVQIGLTATPREIITTENTPEAQEDMEISADNLKYFGEPVYEYSITQGIEDGYLAACQIQKGRVNLDETGITLEQIASRNPRDAITGRTLTVDELKERYEKTEYENRILLPDRVLAMCSDLFDYLVSTGGPEQKTIIFCARDRHADDVAATMNNLYAEWCSKNNLERKESYAFKCTQKGNGNDYLPDFRGASRHHFIATTVELLTTGVDVPCVKNIVFFKYVKSPISFYQMVGRGTRIDEPSNKMMFTVYDYTNATRLFGEDFRTKKKKSGPKGPGPEPPPPPPPPEPTVIVDGFEVYVNEAGKYILGEIDGKPVPIRIEEYKRRIARRLVDELPDLDAFRQCWIDPANRRSLIDNLVGAGCSPKIIQTVEEMDDYDLYDVLAELGYGLAPQTRILRAEAFKYKHSDWLKTLPDNTAATLKAITGQFAGGGTDSLESQHIFELPEIINAGGLNALSAIGKPADILKMTKERIFAA
ncbi:DEAD/DEAH box helicase family protein [Limihaloglobus sulfuriphilus]|nr:DEAD/DEAH box helicase family protein [Limihaloglobus sulfuriphilus]